MPFYSVHKLSQLSSGTSSASRPNSDLNFVAFAAHFIHPICTNCFSLISVLSWWHLTYIAAAVLPLLCCCPAAAVTHQANPQLSSGFLMPLGQSLSVSANAPLPALSVSYSTCSSVSSSACTSSSTPSSAYSSTSLSVSSSAFTFTSSTTASSCHLGHVTSRAHFPSYRW